MENFYEILCVDPASTQDEIKKKYRELAKKFHPDVNKASDAEASFKQINAAYETLSDTEKRQQYDAKRNQQVNENIFASSTDNHFFKGWSAGQFVLAVLAVILLIASVLYLTKKKPTVAS